MNLENCPGTTVGTDIRSLSGLASCLLGGCQIAEIARVGIAPTTRQATISYSGSRVWRPFFFNTLVLCVPSSLTLAIQGAGA